MNLMRMALTLLSVPSICLSQQLTEEQCRSVIDAFAQQMDSRSKQEPYDRDLDMQSLEAVRKTQKEKGSCAAVPAALAASDLPAKREEQRAIEFALRSQAIATEVGGIKQASVSSTLRKGHSTLPHRMYMYVIGVRSNTFAAIDVSRSKSGKEIQFSVACTSKLSPSNHESHKDFCE